MSGPVTPVVDIAALRQRIEDLNEDEGQRFVIRRLLNEADEQLAAQYKAETAGLSDQERYAKDNWEFIRILDAQFEVEDLRSEVEL